MAPVRSLYVAKLEPESGVSLVVLSLLEMLRRRTDRVGYFEVVEDDGDHEAFDRLVEQRFGIARGKDFEIGATRSEVNEALRSGRRENLRGLVLERYSALRDRSDFVLCRGTNYQEASSFEFEINVGLARDLGAPVLLVASARDRDTPSVIRLLDLARRTFHEFGCALAAVLVNRIAPERVEEVRRALAEAEPPFAPCDVIPENERLHRPTIGGIASALGAEVLRADEGDLDREVQDFAVAAMTLPNFLEHLREGSLIVAPGDRSDVLMGAMAAAASDAYPRVAGILLTGGLRPAASVVRLLEGMSDLRVPVLGVSPDTYETAVRLGGVRGAIDTEARAAAALGHFEEHVDVARLEEQIAAARVTAVSPAMFQYELQHRARSERKRIVLPEGNDERILRAAEILHARGVAELVLLGNVDGLRRQIAQLGLALDDVGVIDPESAPEREDFARTYFELREHRGVTEERAFDTLGDVSYFGTMMVYRGAADGMVSGAAHTTQHTIRPAFEFIKTRPGVALVSSVFFMCLPDRVLVYGDCAVNPRPTSEQLADIAITSAETARSFGVEPRVAMLSYSTGESGKGSEVERVREATRVARELRPDLPLDGPIQYDAAAEPSVAAQKMPESTVAGRATVFIFPDLNTGNNTYKAVQRTAGAIAIGPVLQGLRKPVNDLSRGCLVPDIVNTVAITAIQAQAE